MSDRNASKINSSVRRRVLKSIAEKLEILNFIKNKNTHSHASKRFRLSRAAVIRIMKDRDLITKEAATRRNSRKNLRQNSHYSVIDERMIEWHRQVEISHPVIKLTEDMLKAKAIELRNVLIEELQDKLPCATMRALMNFKASNGWLSRYLMRRRVNEADRCIKDPRQMDTLACNAMPAARSRPKVLLCASGSVATVKLPEIAIRLQSFADVTLVLSSFADFFFQRAKEYNPEAWMHFLELSKVCVDSNKTIPTIALYRDQDEWSYWHSVGDKVLHIELKDWADILLLAPLSANTLGKISNGLADNLLTCIARAWPATKPCLFAPAMNTDMWEHPLTAQQVKILTDDLHYAIIPPVRKKLACGVIGIGGLALVDDIVSITKQRTLYDRWHGNKVKKI